MGRRSPHVTVWRGSRLFLLFPQKRMEVVLKLLIGLILETGNFCWTPNCFWKTQLKFSFRRCQGEYILILLTELGLLKNWCGATFVTGFPYLRCIRWGLLLWIIWCCKAYTSGKSTSCTALNREFGGVICNSASTYRGNFNIAQYHVMAEHCGWPRGAFRDEPIRYVKCIPFVQVACNLEAISLL